MFLICSFNFVYNVKLAPKLYCALEIKLCFYRYFSVQYLISLTQPTFFKPKNDIPKIKIKLFMIISPNSEKGKSESAITYPIKAFQKADILCIFQKIFPSQVLPVSRIKKDHDLLFYAYYFLRIRYFWRYVPINMNASWLSVPDYPAGIYLLKVNNRNTRTRCEICSKLTVKATERRQASFWCLYC